MPNFQHNIVLNGSFIAVIDGNKCKSITSFFEQISKAMNFPDYFGNNIDAFDEMMSDLEWIEEKNIVLIIMNYEHFLSEDKELISVVNGIFFRATVELESFKVNLSVQTQKL
jgi:RNAse (barnase) inhibitor barstar